MFEGLVDELVDLTESELDDFIRAREEQRREVEAELATAIAVAEGRSLYASDGHRSMKGYLRATCNWSNAEVARFRGAARAVDAHREVGEAWLDGRIGSVQVAELARVRSHPSAGERFGEFVTGLVEHAEQMPFDDFRMVLERFVALSDADGRLDERSAIERRVATVADTSGELSMSMSGGDATTTAEFAAIVGRFEQAEFRKDRARRLADQDAGLEVGSMRTGPQRRFDAVIAMARCAAAAEDSPVLANDPLVSVVVDQRTMSWVIAHAGLGAATSLEGESIDPFTGLPLADGALDDLLGDPAEFLERRCETSTGVPLRPSDVLRALLSGHVRRVVLGTDRRVIDMGRSSRVFTGAARDAARLLTTSCDHPGCDMPADWCQIDHVVEWHRGGTTDQSNAALECAVHNVDKHRRRRRTRRASNGRVHTFRSDGTIIVPVGCRAPSFDHDRDDGSDVGGLDSGLLVDDIELTDEARRFLTHAARARLALLSQPTPE